jgi:Tfp pilus assembly protein PilF
MGAVKPSRSKKYLLLAVVLTAAIVGGLVWRYLRPRVINVVVVSDYAFRERRNWDAVLDARFRAVNQIFRGTGVEWRVINAEHLDPVANIAQLDQRRLELERREDSPADVAISLTAQPEGDRLGSVNPFSHVAVVVDFPQQSEAQNTLNLAHELARLFAAPVEPAGSGTVMAFPPRSPGFAPRTAALIRQLRDYNFAAGIESLKEKWERRAVQALAEAYTNPSPKPLSHAHITLALALAAERHAAEAVPEAREAVKADPQSVDARQALAHALVDDLQAEAATRELREAIRLFPRDAALHGFLGSVLGTQAETDEALSELRTAEALDPKNANYPVVVGSLLVSQTGQMDEAVTEFQKAAQLDPQQPAAQRWLHRMDDLNTQAHADLEADRRKAREAPQDANVHYRIGVDEARLGDHESARQEFQKAVDLNPRNGRALADLAAMEYYANDYDAAWRHMGAARAAGFEPNGALVIALERKLKAQSRGAQPLGSPAASPPSAHPK